MDQKKRRHRGEGSVYSYGPPDRKRYRAQLPGGKVKKAGFKSSRDAWVWIRETHAKKPTAAGTLDNWLATWLAQHKPDVAPKTYEHDEWRVRKWIQPGLGALPLRDLTGQAIRSFLARLAEQGASDSERQKAGAVLRKCLNAALAAGLLADNPMNRIKLPTPRRPEPVALTPEQLTALVQAAEVIGRGGALRAWVDACLRPAELFALQAQDIEFSTGRLSVKRSLCNVTHRPKETKTKRSRRTVPLASATLDALRGELASRGPADPVWPAEDGGVWWPSNFLRRCFQPLLRSAGLGGLKGFTPKGLRHTGATLLLRSNRVPLKVVSERLGHEDVTTTLRVYQHVLDGDQERAAAVMDELLICPRTTH